MIDRLVKENKVLVFGTFDGIHPGHIHFLKEAKKLGDLYISVSSNESALQRKGKHPIQNVKQRIEALEQLGVATKVSEGDKTLNDWTAIKEIKPSTIALGFDQYGLKTALADIQEKFSFDIKIISHK